MSSSEDVNPFSSSSDDETQDRTDYEKMMSVGSADDISTFSSSSEGETEDRATLHDEMMNMKRRYWPIPAEISKSDSPTPVPRRRRHSSGVENASQRVRPSCSRALISSSSEDEIEDYSYETDYRFSDMSEGSSNENVVEIIYRNGSPILSLEEINDEFYRALDAQNNLDENPNSCNNNTRRPIFHNVGPLPSQQQVALAASMVESVYQNPVINGLLTACYHPSPDYCEEPTRPYENESKHISTGPGSKPDLSDDSELTSKDLHEVYRELQKSLEEAERTFRLALKCYRRKISKGMEEYKTESYRQLFSEFHASLRSNFNEMRVQAMEGEQREAAMNRDRQIKSYQVFHRNRMNEVKKQIEILKSKVVQLRKLSSVRGTYILDKREWAKLFAWARQNAKQRCTSN